MIHKIDRTPASLIAPPFTDTWEYSWAAIELLKDYKAKFPQIFEVRASSHLARPHTMISPIATQAIEANPDHDALDPAAVFGADFAAKGAAASAWKREKGIAGSGGSLVPADAASVSATSILAIERLLLTAAPSANVRATCTAALQLLTGVQTATVKVHPGYLCRQSFSTAVPATACLLNPYAFKA